MELGQGKAVEPSSTFDHGEDAEHALLVRRDTIIHGKLKVDRIVAERLDLIHARSDILSYVGAMELNQGR